MTLVNFASPLTVVIIIILYADDILLISPSVTYTERLLHRCEQELSWLDMNINVNKSCCLRIGPRCDIVFEAVAARAIVDYTLGHQHALLRCALCEVYSEVLLRRY